MYYNIHGSNIYNSPNLEITKMPKARINSYSYNGILLTVRKRLLLHAGRNEFYKQMLKPEDKMYILCDSICIKFEIRQNQCLV